MEIYLEITKVPIFHCKQEPHEQKKLEYTVTGKLYRGEHLLIYHKGSKYKKLLWPHTLKLDKKLSVN